MKDAKRRIRQEKIARILYELGMDVELVANISGVEKEKVEKFNKCKNIKNV